MRRPLTTRTAMAVTRKAGVHDRYAGRDKASGVIRLGIAPSDAQRAMEAITEVWPDAVVEYSAIGHTLEITEGRQ